MGIVALALKGSLDEMSGDTERCGGKGFCDSAVDLSSFCVGVCVYVCFFICVETLISMWSAL